MKTSKTHYYLVTSSNDAGAVYEGAGWSEREALANVRSSHQQFGCEPRRVWVAKHDLTRLHAAAKGDLDACEDFLFADSLSVSEIIADIKRVLDLEG